MTDNQPEKPMTKYGVVQPTDEEQQNPKKLQKTGQEKADKALRDAITRDPQP